jgi:hypothetical protein
MTVLDIARLFKYVRELPGNKGLRVEAIQRWTEGQPGDPWCCCYATMVLDLYYCGALGRERSPFPRTAGCDVVLKVARDQGWVTDMPVPGDVYLRMKDPNDAVHIGFVTTPIKNGRFGQISGNTSADGLSNNGDGVYERDVPYVPEKYLFVRLPQ